MYLLIYLPVSLRHLEHKIHPSVPGYTYLKTRRLSLKSKTPPSLYSPHLATCSVKFNVQQKY